MDLMLSVFVLLAIALIVGAVVLWRRGGSRMQIALMLLLAAIVAGNVALLVVPTSSGTAPIDGKLN